MTTADAPISSTDVPGEPTAWQAPRGVFVAFEGGDGAGKTTQINRLADQLRAAGRTVTVSREPGGTPLGVSVRELVLHAPERVSPRAEALLFAADRAHHVATVVRPAMARGEVVITDRYLDSSVAYQGAGRELSPTQIRNLSLWAVDGLLPDLTVLLDVSPEVGRARRGAVHDKLESEADAFHGRVRAHFRELAAAEPGRYLVLDAARPIDELAAAICDRVSTMIADAT